MENEIIKYFIGNGPFAILFLWLFFDTRKESKAREEQLNKVIDKSQNIISELAKKLDVVEEIKEDVEDIKIKVNK